MISAAPARTVVGITSIVVIWIWHSTWICQVSLDQRVIKWNARLLFNHTKGSRSWGVVISSHKTRVTARDWGREFSGYSSLKLSKNRGNSENKEHNVHLKYLHFHYQQDFCLAVTSSMKSWGCRITVGRRDMLLFHVTNFSTRKSFFPERFSGGWNCWKILLSAIA